MNGSHSAAFSQLIDKLDEFIRKYYKNQIIRGALYSTALLVAGYLLVVFSEYFGRFSVPVRTGLFWLFVTGTLFVVGKLIVAPVLKLFHLGEVLSHEDAARIIGDHFPEVSDKLINTLQLSGQASSARENELLIASINQRISALRPIPFSSAIDFRENRRYLRFALPPLGLLLIILLTDATILTKPTQRLLRYNQYTVEEAPFTIKLVEGELKALEGSTVTLEFEVSGNEIPQSVYVEYGGQQLILQQRDARHHSYTFRNVQENLPFRLQASGYLVGEYLIEVIPAPRILEFTAHLDYPSYLRRTAENVRNAGDLTVPEGTRITWDFAARNSDRLIVSLPDSIHEIRGTGGTFKLVYDARHSGTYVIRPQRDAVITADSLRYRLQVIADQVPSISVDEVRDSTTLGLVYFTGDVKDDYGFRRLVFRYSRTDGNSPEEVAERTVELPVSREFNSDSFFYTWNLREAGLTPGAQFSYYFEIWDNDGVNGSKSARSMVRTYRIPDEKELKETFDQKNADIKDQLEESIKDSKKLQRELEELRRQMLDKQQMNWQDKKRLEELMKMQQQLQKQVQEVQDQNNQKNKMQNEMQQQSESVLEKQKLLEELMNQVMSPELQKMMDELQRLMNELDKDKLQDQLEKMSLSNEDLEKELDRALEQFKQLEWEQKMEQAIDELNKLAEEQEKLAEQSEQKNANAEEIKQAQDELNKKFDELTKELDRLEELNKDLENPNKMPDTSPQEQDIRNEQQKSSDDLQKNKKSSASKSQKNAGQKMKEMAQQMQLAMESGEQEQQQEDMDALRALLENIIRLSFDQEDLMGQFKTIDIKDPKYNTLGQRQRKLKDDARMVEDSLFALSKRVPQISAAVNREINLINDHMRKAIGAIPDRRTPEVTTSQQYVMTSLNNLALMLDEALRQMQQQASSSKPGQGNCEKPGGSGSKPKPSSGEIKKMQEALSKQLEQLKKEGKNKGENKGQDGQMSKQLAEMAAKQAAIRKMLEDKAAELNQDGSGQGNEMKQIAKDMEQLQKDIVNNQVTEESLRRQQDILIRLLKAENAERVREQDNERKSNEAKDFPLSNPQRYADYMRRKERETEMLRTVPPGMKPYYRDRVNAYFERLSTE